VAFAAAHANGRPQRALPQKPKVESLNLGFSITISPGFSTQNPADNRPHFSIERMRHIDYKDCP
jgi:hypothetical protein